GRAESVLVFLSHFSADGSGTPVGAVPAAVMTVTRIRNSEHVRFGGSIAYFPFPCVVIGSPWARARRSLYGRSTPPHAPARPPAARAEARYCAAGLARTDSVHRHRLKRSRRRPPAALRQCRHYRDGPEHVQ